MPLSSVVETAYLKCMDGFFSRWPQIVPPPSRLEQCKLISHRGQHDNRTIIENTFPAFDGAAAAGVWGLEFDIRWTRDLVPVVVHDPDLARLFQNRRRIDQMSFKELQAGCSAIPSLDETVARYGRRIHLMIELKETHWRDPLHQNRILDQTLSPLRPITDYHVLALSPEALTPLTGIPRKAQIAIAYQWAGGLYRWVRRTHRGGLCAHYGMMRNSLIRQLKDCELKVGTGYAGSRNCLFREINRGIDWIFTNKAVALQTIINTMTIDRIRTS
jgi:glycerophosphoryl diester phosphodiesterase